MDARITDLEKEISLITQSQEAMSDSLRSIAKSLARIGEVQMDMKLFEERFTHLNDNLKESFTRVHKRMDTIDEKVERYNDKRNRSIEWLVLLIIGALVTGITTFIMKGGLNV